MKFTGKDGTMRIYERAGGYNEVHFKNMDFSGPIGRPKMEETLVLDRGKANCLTHYINPSEMVLYDPVPISFSFVIESTSGVLVEPRGTEDRVGSAVVESMKCRDGIISVCGATTWTQWGASTKGFYQNQPGLDNPRFTAVLPNRRTRVGEITAISYNGTSGYTEIVDNTQASWQIGTASDMIIRMTSGTSQYKTFYIMQSGSVFGDPEEYHIEGDQTTVLSVGDTYEIYDNMRCVDVEFQLNTLAGVPITWVYREVYFPLDEITLAEAEDAITISASGGVYGPILRSTNWVAPLT